ncbi:MAG: hypothetical protein AMXMBFR66_23700 [Pseudomonadota bacterium]
MKRIPLPALPAVLVLAAGLAFAQGSAPAAKKELVAKLLKLQQPGIEQLARTLAEQPAQRLILSVQSSGVLQRIAADKREALGKDLDADLRKYLDEAVPLLRERALALAPTTIGPVLEERLSEDELRQLANLLGSPVLTKYQSLLPEMQRALGEKLVVDAKGQIEPKLQALQKAVNDKLAAAAGAPPGPASGARR